MGCCTACAVKVTEVRSLCCASSRLPLACESLAEDYPPPLTVLPMRYTSASPPCPSQGKVDQYQALGVSRELRERGYALMCVAFPLTDCRMETVPEDEVYDLQFGSAFAAQVRSRPPSPSCIGTSTQRFLGRTSHMVMVGADSAWRSVMREGALYPGHTSSAPRWSQGTSRFACTCNAARDRLPALPARDSDCEAMVHGMGYLLTLATLRLSQRLSCKCCSCRPRIQMRPPY